MPLTESRSEAARTHDRLMLLVRAGEMFHRSLDIEQTLYNVARLAVESFADLCLFDLLDERSDRLYVTAGAHRDPDLERLIKKVEGLLYNSEFRTHPVLEVSRTGRVFFLPELNAEVIAAHAASRQHAEYMRELGYRSKIVVPVMAHGEIFGALTFVLTRQGGRFDNSDVELASELGRRAGLAIANAKQFQREQHVAATLQRAFLTREFPNSEGLRFYALYRPALSEAELGGDWYDAFRMRSGKVLVTIGDVAGKGVEAARIMVQIRQAIRIASVASEDPADMLYLVNEALLIDPSQQLATAFIGVIDPATNELSYASAGHVPPFCRQPNGEVEELAAPAPPLGIDRELRLETHRVRIADGAMLVLYTDGVTEIRRDVLAGEKMLKDVLSYDSVLHAANPARFVERALCGDAPRDDIAIMTVRFGKEPFRWRLDAGDPRAAFAVKSDFLNALAGLVPGISRDDLQSCELIFAELIGNCVRHAPGALSLALEYDGEAHLHVIDEGPGFDYDPKLPIDIWSETGRGLFLITMLSESVEVKPLPGRGSHISVVLPIHSEAPKSHAAGVLQRPVRAIAG